MTIRFQSLWAIVEPSLFHSVISKCPMCIWLTYNFRKSSPPSLTLLRSPSTPYPYLKCVIWFSNRTRSLSLISSKRSFSSTVTVPIPSGLKEDMAWSDRNLVCWHHQIKSLAGGNCLFQKNNGNDRYNLRRSPASQSWLLKGVGCFGVIIWRHLQNCGSFIVKW